MSAAPVCLAVAAALAAATAGCGLGPGRSGEGEADLRVTRDYGAELIAEVTASDPSESETVIRMLDREADVETRYGGGFVQSIDGITGGVEGGRSFDWFFYVNGVESPVGSAEVRVHGGDRIWWDHRDWTDAMRVPAVVGAWPEPFAQASAGSDLTPVRVECATDSSTCDDAAERLSEEGVDASTEKHRPGGEAAGEVLRMVVGEWPRVSRDPAARLLDQGPARSGVFASFEGDGSAGWALQGLDEKAAPALELGRGSGLVAAVREGEEPPAWLVVGTDREGAAAAVAVLSEDVLRDRYAVAVGGGETTALPVGEAG